MYCSLLDFSIATLDFFKRSHVFREALNFSDLSIFFERGGPQGARLPERPEGFKTTMGGVGGGDSQGL